MATAVPPPPATIASAPAIPAIPFPARRENVTMELIVGIFVLVLGFMMVSVGSQLKKATSGNAADGKLSCTGFSNNVKRELEVVEIIGYVLMAAGGLTAIYGAFELF